MRSGCLSLLGRTGETKLLNATVLWCWVAHCSDARAKRNSVSTQVRNIRNNGNIYTRLCILNPSILHGGR
jgi:hypothetical protein